MTAAPPRRVAVVLRTHRATPLVRRTLERLGPVLGDALHVQVDETAGPVPVEHPRILRFTLARLEAMGLATDFPSVLWYAGDYAFYPLMEDLPDHDHVALFDHDLAFSDAGVEWLGGLVAALREAGRAPDLYAPVLHRGLRHDFWNEGARRMFGREAIDKAFFPFIVLSRRAGARLLAQRQAARLDPARAWRREVDTMFQAGLEHCESFVCHGLAGDWVAGMGEFGPVADTSLCLVNDALWEGDPRLDGERSALLHPVLGEAEFVARVDYLIAQDWPGSIPYFEGTLERMAAFPPRDSFLGLAGRIRAQVARLRALPPA